MYILRINKPIFKQNEKKWIKKRKILKWFLFKSIKFSIQNEKYFNFNFFTFSKTKKINRKESLIYLDNNRLNFFEKFSNNFSTKGMKWKILIIVSKAISKFLFYTNKTYLLDKEILWKNPKIEFLAFLFFKRKSEFKLSFFVFLLLEPFVPFFTLKKKKKKKKVSYKVLPLLPENRFKLGLKQLSNFTKISDERTLYNKILSLFVSTITLGKDSEIYKRRIFFLNNVLRLKNVDLNKKN